MSCIREEKMLMYKKSCIMNKNTAEQRIENMISPHKVIKEHVSKEMIHAPSIKYD